MLFLKEDTATGTVLRVLGDTTRSIMVPSVLSDVCLKENMTLADKLYNLQLIQDFCKDNLNSCCHFSLEDMLYASSTIKVLPL